MEKAPSHVIQDEIDQFIDEMIAIRHDLHQHPELAYNEHRTSAIVADLLKKWGYEVTTGLGKTGVVGQLKLGDGKKSLGIRADFDALPIEEMTNLSYSSKNEGVMHACGHDGHTTMLLTAARYLAQTQSFNGTLNVIFQPAEEGGAGAKAMMNDGLFEKFPCDSIFAAHNWPGAPLGQLAFRSGPSMSSSDDVIIRFVGRGGHGAQPHDTVDPIMMGAYFLTALQTIVSRNVPPLETAIITVGTFHAGQASNVIPDSAELRLTVRCFSPVIRDLLQKRIEGLASQQAQSFGGKAEVEYNRGYPVLVNDEAETQFGIKVARSIFPEDQVNTSIAPATGSEDFAYMLEACQGCYFMMGNGDSAPVHSPHFDFNDKLIGVGGTYWSALVQQFLR